MSISSLPTDVLKYIMGFLPAKELGRICTVSKLWNACASSFPCRVAELFPTTALVLRVDLEGVNPIIDKPTYLNLRETLRKKGWLNLDKFTNQCQLVTSVEKARRVCTVGEIAIRNEDLVQVGGPPQKFNITSQGPGRKSGSWGIWIKRG